MHLTYFFSTILLIPIYNQIFSLAIQIISTSTSTTQTLTTKTTSDVIDLQDGHPNHRLWQKMIDSERASSRDWYVIYFDRVFSSFSCFIPFRECCTLIKLTNIYIERERRVNENDEWQVHRN